MLRKEEPPFLSCPLHPLSLLHAADWHAVFSGCMRTHIRRACTDRITVSEGGSRGQRRIKRKKERPGWRMTKKEKEEKHFSWTRSQECGALSWTMKEDFKEWSEEKRCRSLVSGHSTSLWVSLIHIYQQVSQLFGQISNCWKHFFLSGVRR